MKDVFKNDADLRALFDELEAMSPDAVWEALSREFGNRAVARVLASMLGREDGATDKPQAPVANYLGEPLACRSWATSSTAIEVGPIPGLIERRVRALGAGHSSSGVAAGVAEGTLLKTMLTLNDAQLDRLDESVLKEGVDPDAYVVVPGGMTLSDLNRRLQDRGLAMDNLPAYMGLTVAGVLSTAAHGSGASFGPFCDQVVAVTLVKANRERIYVEAAHSITDEAKWKEVHGPRGTRFVADDDVFRSVVVGVGCMGAIEAVVLSVRRAFLLSEVRKLSTWGAVKEDLVKRRFADRRHYEVTLSPYKQGDEADWTCTIVTREKAPKVECRLTMARQPSYLADVLFPGIGLILASAINKQPKLGPVIARGLVQVLGADDGATHEPGHRRGGPSYEVLDLGGPDRVKGVATEIAFLMKDRDPSEFIAAVDALLARAAEQLRVGGWQHSLPISLRFSAASHHYLAMQHGDPSRDTVGMIELLALYDVSGHEDAIKAFQESAVGRGRPHWGQRNQYMRGGTAQVFPQLDRWRATRRRLDPDGRFRNAVTDAFGLAEDPAPGPTVRGSGKNRHPPILRVLHPEKAISLEDTYFLPGTNAVEFARVFREIKSHRRRFGPLELIRQPGREGELFEQGEYLQGRMRLDRRLFAEVAARPVPESIRSLFDLLRGFTPVIRFLEKLADLFSSNHCQITLLRMKPSGDDPVACKYEFLEGSPATGYIEFKAVDEEGGCRVTHTFFGVPVNHLSEVMLGMFGTRMTQVVAYIEVEAAARALGSSMVTNVDRPTDAEACRSPMPERRLPLDPQNAVSIKRDVRQFLVGCPARRFVDGFRKVLSFHEDFGIFLIERQNPANLFKKGDRFKGTIQMTNGLEMKLRALRPPPRLGAAAWRAILEAAITRFRDEPPADYGEVTRMDLSVSGGLVRYDYLEGTPVAGHSVFSVAPADESERCRVTQTFVYQEQDLLTVNSFGTIGLYVHNLVVETEIELTARNLGVGWSREDDPGVP